MTEITFTQDVIPNEKETELSRSSLFSNLQSKKPKQKITKQNNDKKEKKKVTDINFTDQTRNKIYDSIKTQKISDPQTDKEKKKLGLFENSELLPELTESQLDITTQNFDFDHLGESIEEFISKDEFKKSLEEGIDLRAYAKQIDQELWDISFSNIEDYLSSTDLFVSFHEELNTCDKVLGSLESMLDTFQNSLGSLPSEITSLQEETYSLHTKVTNRRNFEKKIDRVVEELALSQDFIHNLTHSPIDETYFEIVEILEKKLKYCNKEIKKKEGKFIAANELKPQLKKGCEIICKRAINFFLEKFNYYSKHRGRVQIKKQTEFLKYRFLIKFVQKHDPRKAKEIIKYYKITFSKIFYESFQKMFKQINRLKMDTVTKTDLIGLDYLPVSTGIFSTKKKKILNKNLKPFEIGNRNQILDKVDRNPLHLENCIKKKKTLPFETLFRTLNLILLRIAKSEFLFTSDFFNNPHISSNILKLTINSVENFISAHVRTNNDPIGILLMIKINHLLNISLFKESIPILDSYFDNVNMILWPTFKKILENNIQSIKSATKNLNVNSNSINIFKFNKNKNNQQSDENQDDNDGDGNDYDDDDDDEEDKMMKIDLLTKKYTIFINSILSVNKHHNEEIITFSLKFLRIEIEKYLSKKALQIKDSKKQLLYLIKIYDYILTTLNKSEIDSEETQRFKLLSEEQISIYIELVIGKHFSKLIRFVKRWSLEDEKKKFDQNGPEIKKVQSILSSFQKNWKKKIQLTNEQILNEIKNLDNSSFAFKSALSQIMKYYARFLDLVNIIDKKKKLSYLFVDISIIINEVKRICKPFFTKKK
ncbi:vacuolar protein sorting-associated protein [Anaeramoeba flamelloides]|uniref:Vacuolar protein sorting-associated protein n=1 Tax=Anaeramoeba flamelloides TaxID=1746091 RepID=A0ABQ8YAA5_9EUKA|nr:vacuolar protein sorting-associated protein [Anaeramoeba flamelloides]